jgi:hypothetical protein
VNSPRQGDGVTTEQAVREFIAMVRRDRRPGPGFRRVVAEVLDRLLAGETIQQILDGARPGQRPEQGRDSVRIDEPVRLDHSVRANFATEATEGVPEPAEQPRR